MRSHDWSGFSALGAGMLSLAALAFGHRPLALVLFSLAVICGILTRYWSLKYPAPIPYFLRWTLLVPRGNQSPAHLLRILEPAPGERILEIGPGVGTHAIPVAAALASASPSADHPAATLDVFDVQQAMLDDVMRRAARVDVTNITPTLGDARELPYDDATFDAAYIVGVLGEIPDGDLALREVRRVLKPAGRLVIGEVAFDPDFIFFGSLVTRAGQASFAFDRRLGGSLSYLARFRPA